MKKDGWKAKSKHKSEVAILTSNETFKKKSNTKDKEKFYDNIAINSSKRHNSLKCSCLLTVKFQAWINRGFPCGSAGKESACNGGDLGSIPGLGRSPGEGKGYLLQYPGLENSMDYSPWGLKESDTTEQLSLSLNVYFCWLKGAKKQNGYLGRPYK